MINSKRQADVLGDLGKVSRHPEVTRAQAYIREQGEEIAALRERTREQAGQAAAYRQALGTILDMPTGAGIGDHDDCSYCERRDEVAGAVWRSTTAGQALLDRQKELEEALRSMVTVYVGVIKDHFDQTTSNNVLEEPPVKRARILLGLEPAPAEQKGVEPR